LSKPLNANSRAAVAIAEEFYRSGITEACISPGSRSSAMVLALLKTGGIRPWVILDERSAGFFALGMARETKQPVVLLCTSGTAAANYLPAVAEASLSDVPLILVTSDRPPEQRDCNAPQTIDQVGLYGGRVRWSVDLPPPSTGAPDLEAYHRTIACRAVAAALGPRPGPVQINLPMREPLIDVNEEKAALESAALQAKAEPRPPYITAHRSCATAPAATLEALVRKLDGIERGLIICGPGTGGVEAAEAIAALAKRLRWPILADPLSGLRFGGHDRSQVVDSYDLLLRHERFCREHRPDGVIQFGRPLVSKSLMLFLAGVPGHCYLLVATPGTWPDPLHRVTDIVRADSAELCAGLTGLLAERPPHSGWLDSWLSSSKAVREAVEVALSRHSEIFEGRVLSEIFGILPAGSTLHVGNSLPVRELDTFMGGSDRAIEVFCNRGANGIDGVTSAAFGAAAVRRLPTALVLGDLSFLHDIGALQIAARYPIHLVIVVINNDGGGIFSFLPQASLGETFETFFATAHGLDLEAAVRMCGGRYTRAGSWEEFSRAVETGLSGSGLHVTEIRSDRTRNPEIHRRIVEAALDKLDHSCGFPEA